MEHILSLSYGKDSIACLGAIEQLGWKLDRIITADIYATDTILADLPIMVEFKEYADRKIKDKYGIEVEHYRSKNSYEDIFYRKRGEKSKSPGKIYGFPCQRSPWCTGELKQSVLKKIQKDNIVYLGIAADEPKRFHNLTDVKKSPLVEAGWTEEACREWCKKNDLLSPIYTNSARGGCWFCHSQSMKQLRTLRHDNPEYWNIMLKWDSDAPVPFHSDGHTIHDFDKRFELEDMGIIDCNKRFLWKMVEEN